ncbi:hypothetical protein SBOR_7369 [Sclerotinia borealis F-4128]|uniref:Uncharacterized protein n=1 Tax=Sclerotinia borealis (strain F-4128) TaxID=1432307 RepID=W9C8W4_SCLBF|nr:hypothetical protein SBOR_7369 [Sclerotinia borealis F-4128]
MGNKNNRGRIPAPRAVELYAERKLAEKQLAERQQAEKLALEKQQAEELIRSFDPSTVPQHDLMTIEHVKDTKKLIIDLDFMNRGFIVNMASLLETLPVYAPFIVDITIRLYAPAKHTTQALYKDRKASMKKMVNILNKFNVNKMDIIIGLNSDNFLQMRLAAFVHGLNFQKWTMSYHIFDQEGETALVATMGRGSVYGRRLHGVYKAEFQAQ